MDIHGSYGYKYVLGKPYTSKNLVFFLKAIPGATIAACAEGARDGTGSWAFALKLFDEAQLEGWVSRELNLEMRC